MRIYLLRHGEDKHGKLTFRGKHEVKNSACFLKEEGITAIYSSPKRRCIDSSNIVAKKLKLDVSVINELKEREGLKKDIETDDEKAWWDNYLNQNFSHHSPEGGKEFFGRIQKVLKDIIDKHDKNDRILIVGHSAHSYALNAYFNHNKEEAIWSYLGYASVICFEVKDKNKYVKREKTH